jgi:hypothetical protein
VTTPGTRPTRRSGMLDRGIEISQPILAAFAGAGAKVHQ